MSLGPACPDCAKHIPLMRTQWNLGKPFPCSRCEASLVVPRSNAVALGLGLLVAFYLFRSRFPEAWGGQAGLLALVVVAGLPVTWAATKVRRADIG